MKKLTKLTVDGKRWCRGAKGGLSAMLNQQGNMCCLGFLGKACGLADRTLKNKGTPCSTGVRRKWTKGVVDISGFNTGWTDQAMQINDNILVRDDRRKAMLKQHFAKIGIDIKFKPGQPK